MTLRQTETHLSINPVSDSMNVVSYCVGAMKLFSALTRTNAERIILEISIVKLKGIETSGEGKRYHLSNTGSSFWGLQLLCMEYVFNRMTGKEIEVDRNISNGYITATWLSKGIYKEEFNHFLNE